MDESSPKAQRRHCPFSMMGQAPTAVLSSACTLVACIALTWSSGLDWDAEVQAPRAWLVPLPWVGAGAAAQSQPQAQVDPAAVGGGVCARLRVGLFLVQRASLPVARVSMHILLGCQEEGRGGVFYAVTLPEPIP